MTDHAAALVARYFSADGDELRIGGVGVRELAERFETPLFAYDRGALSLQLERLRRALPSEFAVCYSVKANPNPAIIRHFLDAGCGVEIASVGEYALARRAGALPERILFAGPGKTDVELEHVVASGIGEIHVESRQEIERLAAIAGRLGRSARVAIRVNPSDEALGGALRMGGKAAPFGVDEEELGATVDLVRARGALELRGIHLFAGTQITDHAVLVRQYRKGLEIARRVADQTGRPLATVDFGGGLGIPYVSADRELDTIKLAEELSALMAETVGDARFEATRFVVEPGRYLVGPSGVYVTRVVDVKVSRGKTFAVVDGGMNHHLAASGNLGQVLKRNFPLAALTKLGMPAAETLDVVGPLCTPLDVLARAVALPRLEVGDLIGVFQSGAYARAASPLGFLSHRAPAEVLVGDGTATLIRRRSTDEDLVRDLV